MSLALISQALYLFIKLAILALGSIAFGAIIVGILQVATQIQDSAIGMFGKIAGCAMFLFLFGSSVSNQIVLYSQQLWGDIQFYQ